MKCKKCDKKAKYKIDNPLETWYSCGIHRRKWDNNMMVVITNLKEDE